MTYRTTKYLQAGIFMYMCVTSCSTTYVTLHILMTCRPRTAGTPARRTRPPRGRRGASPGPPSVGEGKDMSKRKHKFVLCYSLNIRGNLSNFKEIISTSRKSEIL